MTKPRFQTARRLPAFFPFLFAIAAPQVAGAQVLANVSVNLGVQDAQQGLSRVAVSDGDTEDVTIGGVSGRKNLAADDSFMYFAVDDAFIANGSRHYAWVYFHYFDRGSGTLKLQYDAGLDPSLWYKSGPTVTLTGTDTWKVYSAELTDAYFGGHQNGGADFRIAGTPGMTFYVDLVYVRVHSNRLPAVDIMPTSFEDNWPNPLPWTDLCLNPSQWQSTLGNIDSLGYGEGGGTVGLDGVSNSDSAQCFTNIRDAKKKFSVGTQVLKEYEACHTSDGCWQASEPRWDRLTELGASIDMLFMDEPFSNAYRFPDQVTRTDEDAVNGTVTWMARARAKYPHVQIASIEAYPLLTAAKLTWWIRALNAACAANSVQVIDFFVVDHDWNASGASLAQLNTIRAESRGNGVLFGIAFWAANKPLSNIEQDWYNGLMQHGALVQSIKPDLYAIQDWTHSPRTIIPETTNFSFTKSVRDFVNSYVTRTMVQGFVDVSPSHPFQKSIYTIASRDVPGCGSDLYCPDGPTTRGSMARFLLKAKEGAQYIPPKCMSPVFGDVPCGSDDAIWINELYWRGITGGCGTGADYCPPLSVSREQMAVFLLVTKEGSGYAPPACLTPTFGDVPCSSPYAPWIEELNRRGITGGCGGGNYCPTGVVSRGEMAVFVGATFALP